MDLMQIVANNLVSNAIKYGNENSRVVLSSAFENDCILVRVFNEGTVISEENKSRLFKKFSRLVSGKKIKGTGLGLFITREIIEKHGGKIWLETQESGNTFVFELERKR